MNTSDGLIVTVVVVCICVSIGLVTYDLIQLLLAKGGL